MGKLKVLDLFSGIGGFSRGLELTGGFETVAFCEISDTPRKILERDWNGVPCYEDIATLSADVLARDRIAADVITGGFPCQAHSSAAHGRNTARDWWPEMARLVTEARPRFAIAENVQRAPVEVAAAHFASLGMQCDVVHIPANAIGADHERSRWWAIAHPYENGEFSSALNAEAQKLPHVFAGVWGAEAYRSAVCLSDGLSGRFGLAEYGNAVVPQIPEMIGHAILQAESDRNNG